MVVAMPAGLIVTATALDVLPVKLESPRYSRGQRVGPDRQRGRRENRGVAAQAGGAQGGRADEELHRARRRARTRRDHRDGRRECDGLARGRGRGGRSGQLSCWPDRPSRSWTKSS